MFVRAQGGELAKIVHIHGQNMIKIVKIRFGNHTGFDIVKIVTAFFACAY